MTTCACCKTTQGPFVGDPDTPGLRICGFPPRLRKQGDEVINKRAGAPFTMRMQRVVECLSRRDAIDNKRYGGTHA